MTGRLYQQLICLPHATYNRIGTLIELNGNIVQQERGF
jgi:hypothetical protein